MKAIIAAITIAITMVVVTRSPHFFCGLTATFNQTESVAPFVDGRSAASAPVLSSGFGDNNAHACHLGHYSVILSSGSLLSLFGASNRFLRLKSHFKLIGFRSGIFRPPIS